MSSVDPVDELTASLQKQSLGDTDEKLPQLPAPAKRYAEELEKTGFTIFKPISDLGFYEWKPDLKDHSPFNKISADEIKRQLDAKGKPAALVDTRKIRLPFAFSNLPPQIYENRYPLTHYEIAGIHVATQIRGLQLNDIDFVFGGSTLSMLANKNESRKVYLATKIPGASVGLVVKDDNYDLDLAAPGFQFERLVTGKSIAERSEPAFTEHMHVMQVGDFKVLFIAEVDAMKDGEPVEVITSNSYFWDIKTCLQCVSSGSPALCHGDKYRGKIQARKGKLESISMKNLSTLYEEESEKLKKAEREIVRALGDLKQELDNSDHSGDYEIAFSVSGRLTLQPEPGSSKLLPSSDVLDALL